MNNGPVSVAVNAGNLQWMLYMGGIIKKGCGTSLDHGVVIVGSGEENGISYWLVRNSWGPGWGEHGYLRIAKEEGPGVCGINLAASCPHAKVD